MRIPAFLPVLGLLALPPAAPLAAQAVDWEVESELAASVFFGNTSQTTIATRGEVARADSAWEVGGDVGFNYGEASDEEGRDFVNKRSWVAGVNADYHPYGRFSPFVMSRVESSLERRIDLRYDLGIGGKVTFVRNDRTRVDFSLAVLAERTLPADQTQESELLARWSSRFRARRALGEERVVLESETFYRPRFDAPETFTLTSRNSVSFQLNEIVSLRLSLVDNYDSEAEERGALSNNEGELLFGLLSSF